LVVHDCPKGLKNAQSQLEKTTKDNENGISIPSEVKPAEP
jgi:hypothetical protein